MALLNMPLQEMYLSCTPGERCSLNELGGFSPQYDPGFSVSYILLDFFVQRNPFPNKHRANTPMNTLVSSFLINFFFLPLSL